MANLTVGPNSEFISIRAAMAAANPSDTIQLEPGYGGETATVTRNGLTITGEASSTGIVLRLGTGIATITLTGNAPINVFDAADGNGIVGNDGDNLIQVSAGVDSVSGGQGHDRLVVDYRLATGAVTGDATSNFTEAGGGGRMVTVNGGFEDFTILTGTGADTITTGAGDDIIRTRGGASTVNGGGGYNMISGGSGADTVTGLDGGNFINVGDGENTVTTGGGVDRIVSGEDADTIKSGGGNDRIIVKGGADTVDAGAGRDWLVVDYADAVTAVSGGVDGGTKASGYVGHIADLGTATLDFVGTENFRILTGSGADQILTGAGDDVLWAGAGDDRFNAAGGADVVRGEAGDDRLLGGAGSDILLGGSGDDILVGGLDRDLLQGGSGRDIFVVEDGAVSRSTADVVADFSRADGDRINLLFIDAEAGGQDDAFSFIGTAAFSGGGAAGELRYSVAGGNTFVEGDTDGDGVADIFLRVSGEQALTSVDFIL